MSFPPVQGSNFPRIISSLSATRSTIEAEIIYDDLFALERAHAKRLHSVKTFHSRRAIIGKTKNRRGGIGDVGGTGRDNNIRNQADSDLEDNDAEGGNAMEEDAVSEEEEEEEEEEE